METIFAPVVLVPIFVFVLFWFVVVCPAGFVSGIWYRILGKSQHAWRFDSLSQVLVLVLAAAPFLLAYLLFLLSLVDGFFLWGLKCAASLFVFLVCAALGLLIIATQKSTHHH